MTRNEMQVRTRRAILDAAKAVFLERGFHGASVAEIARSAGYTTGALYSNFANKDDLFLAMLDEHLFERARSQQVRMAAAETFEASVRAAALDLHHAGNVAPTMSPLMVEFWIYAATRPHLQERVRRLSERQLDWIAELIDEACRRHGVRLRLPTRVVARGGGALSRGLRLERLFDPDGVDQDTFVEMFTAYVLGLEEPS